MKPTYSSHDPPRFQFPDPTGGWSFVDNLRPQLSESDFYQVRQRQKKKLSLGLSRVDAAAAEADDHEVFVEDPCQLGSVAPWTSSKDNASSRRLLRSRSLIRTNPWMSSTGESPPRSPANVHQCRCWSTVERELPPPELFSSRGTQIRPTHPGIETVMSSRFYRRDDSLLTTSIESDSLYQSLTSDTDTATSLLSLSDVTLPEDLKVERARDVICEGSAEEKESRYEGIKGRRGVSVKKFDRGNFEADQTRSNDCGRTFNSGRSLNLHLKRPSFGGKRFSEIADDYETKTTKWLSSAEGGIVTQESHSSRNTDISTTRDDDYCEQLNQRPRTTIQQAIFISRDREECGDVSTYVAQTSTTPLQFRKKILAVRSSLQDKVAMLRREKKQVDEKIREAKEEENIRLIQLEKFRRQLSSTRKEILLRTIEELRRSLNEQSLKLQKLYDVVLLEQRQMICCH